jgi:acetyl esterase/lipase
MQEAAMKILVTLSLFAAIALGQPEGKFSRPPDIENAAYGPHERNVVDLWKAKSERPTPLVIYIHGGGFRGGDKRSLNPALLDMCLERGWSVAAIHYRLSQHAPYPAPMHDSARAVQFLRSKAREWNLDPKAFAATGGSAGAGISLWLGFHEDLAKRRSADPVERQSTRLSVMGVFGAQSTYDPRVIAREIGEAAAQHPALALLYGLKGDEMNTERAFKLFADASAITHLSKGDPPVWMIYGEPPGPLPADAKPGTGIHHPRFGTLLKEQMDKLGIECVVRHRTDYSGDATVQPYREMVAFFARHLRN